jgi:hypothetical protein
MPDTPAALHDDPQAMVTILTTEHFALQSARGITTSESNGRASIYLGAVSAGLVAFAFAGQTSHAAMYTLGLVLFPVLAFLGLTTFDRILQASIDDTLYMRRINRIRRFYIDAVPRLADYLAPAAATDDVEDVLRTERFTPGHWQLLLSVVGAIGVINSVLIGATAGLAVAALTDGELWAAVPTGVAAFAVAVPLHQRHQSRERLQATA